MIANSSKAQHDYLLKIIVIGDPNCGKSSIILQYVDGYIHSSHLSTIGVDFKIKNIRYDEKKIKLQIWDTAGQEKFKHLTNNYYRNAHACIVVYDITNKESFENVEYWMNQFKQRTSVSTPEAGYPNFILAGNKSDLEQQRAINPEEAALLAKSHDCKFIECSAKESKNINQIFNQAIELIFSRFHKSQLRTNWESPFSMAQFEQSSDGGEHKNEAQQLASLMKPASLSRSIRITKESFREAKENQSKKKCC